jgi:transcriptional regulator with XRE-family HTH domain
MSERGNVLSEIVAQLVAEARRQEGLSTDELADRAGVDRTYLGLLERRSRQPTLAVAANLAEALGFSLSELVAEAEHDVDDGSAPELELLPAPPRRETDRAHLRESSQLTATAGPDGETVTRAIDLAYRKLDLVDAQMRGSGSRSIVGLVEASDLSSLLANLFSAGIARASNGNYARGKDSRGDTAAVWEGQVRRAARGRLPRREHGSAGGGARLKKEALDRMELVYYDPALLPYARPTGVYARAR